MHNESKNTNINAFSSSPEFEFWMIRNKAQHENLKILTADELFVDGVLRPLQNLSLTHTTRTQEPDQPVQLNGAEPVSLSSEPVGVSTASGPEMTACVSCLPTSGSKRWKNIFKVADGEKKSPAVEKQKTVVGSAAVEQLNVNIWPFRRSRSAGNNTAIRSSLATMKGRRVSSAPCSRSNSRGETSRNVAMPAVRKCQASPVRSSAAHMDRTGPVWQVGSGRRIIEPGRRFGYKAKGLATKKVIKGGIKVGVINFNMSNCIRYEGVVRCKGDDCTMFNFKCLFSKKMVY